MAFSASQLRFGRLLLILLAVLIVVFNLWPAPRRAFFSDPTRPTQRAWDNLDAIRNETLGVGLNPVWTYWLFLLIASQVQKVFAINLPSRSDKRDNLVLGSSVCDFRVDWVDGVTPDEISPKTYPYNWNHDHKPTEYAARRAHLNVMQRIVNERLGSAIVMEDDADWDISIKAQLQSFALAVRALQSTRRPASTTSPYGDDWDVFWLGHCGIECKTDLPFYQTPNDPTIPEPRHFLPYWRPPPPIDRPDHARLTCATNDGVCSTFYAVSYHGAQRILAALSVSPAGLAEQIDTGAQFDVSLGRMCGNGFLHCFTPYPALTGTYRSAGNSGKSSDIHDEGGAVGFASWGVLYSTMLNINRIIRGEPVRSTWDDVAVPEVIPENISVLEGSLYMQGEKGIYPITAVASEQKQKPRGSMDVS